jgi:hypothetical protein
MITMGIPKAARRYKSRIVFSGTENTSEDSRRKLIIAIQAAK